MKKLYFKVTKSSLIVSDDEICGGNQPVEMQVQDEIGSEWLVDPVTLHSTTSGRSG